MGIFAKAQATVQQIRETKIPLPDGKRTTSTKVAREAYGRTGKK